MIQVCNVRDFRIQSPYKQNVRSSGMLLSVDWLPTMWDSLSVPSSKVKHGINISLKEYAFFRSTNIMSKLTNMYVVCNSVKTIQINIKSVK